jgi:predicted esterase
MKLRCTASGIVALAMVVLGCSGGDGQGANESAVTSCTPGDVSPCACTDGTMSQQTCNASGTYDACACGSAGSGGAIGTGGVVSTGGVISTGGIVSSGGVVGTGGIAGSGGVITATGGVVGTGGDVGGTGALPGTGGDQGGVGGGPIATAQDPAIPPVNGDCPTFTNQTLNFMSLQGIQMQVGPKSNGTGHILFYWHGTGSSAGEVSLMVPQAARQRILDTGGVIISPQSSTGTTAGLQASGTSIWFDEDLAAVDEIVACAVRDYGIDPHRIYATGCSAGGLMSGYMAAQRWQYVAAAAPNSGGALGQTFVGDAHVPPIMTMHGRTGVDVVIIDFAQQSLALDQAVTDAGGFAVDCDHGGGHCGAPADLYTAGMQFLFDHPFGASPEPYASGLPAGFPSYCVIQ